MCPHSPSLRDCVPCSLTHVLALALTKRLRALQHAEEVIAVGDSKEEEDAARACNLKFVKIACASDLCFPELAAARL